MRKGKREFCFRVIGKDKRRRTPSLHRVATFASAAVRALSKLAAVRIGRVTVGALSVRNRRLEVATLVASETRDLGMFTQ